MKIKYTLLLTSLVIAFLSSGCSIFRSYSLVSGSGDYYYHQYAPYSYNTGTYWRIDNSCTEQLEYQQTKQMYRGGHDSYHYNGYGRNVSGESYNSGLRKFPSVCRPPNIPRRNCR